MILDSFSLDATAAKIAERGRAGLAVAGDVTETGRLEAQMIAQAARNIPMARLGDGRDIAACALYLASSASAWVTGRIFDVDGGADAAPLEFPVPAL